MQLLPIFLAALATQASAAPIVPGPGINGIIDGILPSCETSSSKFHCLKERVAEAIVPGSGSLPSCAKSSSKFHCLVERLVGSQDVIEARETEAEALLPKIGGQQACIIHPSGSKICTE